MRKTLFKHCSFTISATHFATWFNPIYGSMCYNSAFRVMSEKVCKILLVLSPMLGKPKHGGNL